MLKTHLFLVFRESEAPEAPVAPPVCNYSMLYFRALFLRIMIDFLGSSGADAEQLNVSRMLSSHGLEQRHPETARDRPPSTNNGSYQWPPSPKTQSKDQRQHSTDDDKSYHGPAAQLNEKQPHQASKTSSAPSPHNLEHHKDHRYRYQQ